MSGKGAALRKSPTPFIRRSAIPLILFLALWLASPCTGGQEVKLRVVAEQANIRHQPDISSRILHQAPRGEVFTSLEKRGEWQSQSRSQSVIAAQQFDTVFSIY